MRRLLTGLLLMALAVPVLRADDKLTRAGEEFQALKKECDSAQQNFKAVVKKLQAAKDPEEKKALGKQFDRVQAEYAKGNFGKRFLEIASKNSKDPVAVEALNQALRNCQGPEGKDGVWEKAIALLQKEFVKAPEITRVLRVLAGSGDEVATEMVRAVLEKNPNRVAQAHAARALRDIAAEAVETATTLKEDKEEREKLELKQGKEYVAKLIAKGQKARADQKELDKLIKRKYSDIIPDLSVGQPVRGDQRGLQRQEGQAQRPQGQGHHDRLLGDVVRPVPGDAPARETAGREAQGQAVRPRRRQRRRGEGDGEGLPRQEQAAVEPVVERQRERHGR